MPAYLRDLTTTCMRCEAPATKRLFNAVNAPLGDFCAKHGQQALLQFWRENPDQAPRNWDKLR